MNQSYDKKIIYYSYCNPVDQIMLRKELGEIPYYFTKLFGYHAIIDDYYDKASPDETMFRTVELQSYKTHNNPHTIKKIFKVFRLAKKIDILYLLSITPDSLFKMLAYRLGGGKGKIYVKMDLDKNGYMKDDIDLLSWKTIPFYLKIPHYLFKHLPDIFTVETKASYDRIKRTYYSDLIDSGKLYLLPNGFDPEVLSECGITCKDVSEKEKLIITVGRLGTHQKNTELLLDILGNVNLKDWKVCLVGPIDSEFRKTIDEFYVTFPDKKDSVIFTGQVSQRDLYDYYNRARVFMLTSRHESYAFVLAEAAYMRDCIITTDVGIAPELIQFGFSEYISKTGDAAEFAEELQRVINLSDDELNRLTADADYEKITWEYILKNNKAIEKLLE